MAKYGSFSLISVLTLLSFSTSVLTQKRDIEDGGLIFGDITIRKYESPLLIRNDVIITEDARVTIEPGVEVRFAPGVMMAVNGTLLAEGTPNDRIKFTMDTSEGGDMEPKWPDNVRLVDERSVMEGRLQMQYKGKWRGVCANFQNWTAIDTNVTCRQLGFNGGIFNFFSWATNDSTYMLYHKPECLGGEDSVLNCQGGHSVQIGSRICANQQTIHLKCEGLAPSVANRYWWGLEFYNSTHRVSQEGRIIINETASKLEHVDIMYAGVSPKGEPVPAIRASPLAPHLIDVRIKNCALDGTNFTNIKGSTIVMNSEISNNRGHGLVVETNIGRVRVINSEMGNNKGNGIKTKFLDGQWPIFDESLTFCRKVGLSGQSYPLVLSGIPYKGFAPPCKQKFITMAGHILTVNFLEMDIEDAAWGELIIRDGQYDWSDIIATVPIRNGSLPQGISSTYEYMHITFNWRIPWQCPSLQDCVKFTILLDSGPSTVPEFFMNNTEVHNNTQHGIFMENVRNYAVVNASELSHNEYGAGFRVVGGAGDIHVNASNINYNQDNGVNITYDGGYRIFNMSSFSNNYGNGINITFNETRVDNKTRYAKQQKTEVYRSTFLENEGLGVRVGNYCMEGKAVVNDSIFINNKMGGVEFESCFNVVPIQNMTNFTVGYCEFENNYGHAIKIAPLINAVGTISNNTFRYHQRHVLLIDNSDDFLLTRYYSQMRTMYSVLANKFFNNEGFYVAHIRLTQGSSLQYLDFKYNVMKDNVIEGAFPSLNERTRAFAVIIVSSSNVNVSRNHLENPGSKYEIATHLLDKSVIIEATSQWWGTTVYGEIIPRIFDQFNRYNLAAIKYHPVLKFPDLYSNILTIDQIPEEIAFNRGSTLGGRLAERFITIPGRTYHVDRDISILPAGSLHISEGSMLEFSNGLGMLVQGELKAQGQSSQMIYFTMKNESTYVNHTRVRLVDGPSDHEGRVEIRPSENDEWGTVCNKGWTIIDSSVVCQMLGLVVHPDDWKIYMANPGPNYQPIWRSRVRCTELDMDITRCMADGVNDHSCMHEQDVSVRCHPPTWAGVRFLATARPSVMRHVTIDRAGLMDPTAILYAPALRIDYNVHTLDHFTVKHCKSSGIEIMHNDVYANAKLSNCHVMDNIGNGISTRAPFFDLEYCDVRNNQRAGFEYNPYRTTYEGQQIRAGIHQPKYINPNCGNGDTSITIPNEGYIFLATSQCSEVPQTTYDVEISVSQAHYVVVDVLDYNPDTNQEKLTVFDGKKANIRPDTNYWMIEKDLVDFPIVSTSNTVTFRYEVHNQTSGRLTFALRSKPWNWKWPFAEVRIRNSTFTENQRGVVTRFYNQPSNEFLDLFFRFRWQNMLVYGSTFQGNKEVALHVPSITKYHELYMPSFEELQTALRLAEITYAIESCHFSQNGGGVKGEHNHIEFSNNVWLWEVTSNRFENNLGGGFAIELPKVNMKFHEIFNHSVDVNDTVFENNDRFEFIIDGFYCNSSIARNRFIRNKCLKGCLTISGTEKDFDMHDNEIHENEGIYMVEFYMTSHTPYTRWVDARVMYNDLKRNKKPMSLSMDPSPTSSPSSYTFGVKGVQNVTIMRNLFANNMDYELIGGQSSSSLETYLDVTENYWGTDNQQEIRAKIFDFDDWNNYAIAEYYPFLLYDNFESPITNEGKWTPDFDLSKPLGGRIETDITLKRRTEPYIIRADLTVMPTATLIIENGVELQFFPNVGILVLGSLSARGHPTDRIKFNPISKNTALMMSKRKRQVGINEEIGSQVRLVGGDHGNQGFIQIFNTTEQRWTLICDSNFNYRTAEVACRTMGMESSNVVVRRDRYYDHFVFGYPIMHEQRLEWFWRNTLICDGREGSLDQCRYKANYNLFTCMEAREYVYVRCGPRNLDPEYDYWGNIRFSTPEYEHGNIKPGYSNLEYVDIHGAGILHEERAAAVQSVYRTPTTNYVRISNCAWNGYDYIAPKDEFLVTNNVIENNNGYGVGAVVLNGESRYEVPLSSFIPLEESAVPYNVYGLVRMCTSEKMIYVKDRILVYFKYRFETVDCIKIIRSKEPRKQVALRFLQINMYNDSFYKNAVEMYNGEYFESDLMIGEVTANSTDFEKRQKYQTSEYFDTLGIRITASPAFGVHGFIAEVVTLPLSPGWRPDLGPGHRQHITQTAMTGNEGGGFKFMNAGELNPSVIIERCRIQSGGVKMLNMTAAPVMDIYVQNSRLMTISNNYIGHNRGGVYVKTNTTALSTAIYANITNNVITHNTFGDPLYVSGHHYQGFEIKFNYISHNDVGFRNDISMFGVHLNFTSNVVFNNTGRTTLNSTVPEKVAINQRYSGNAIYDNFAKGGNHTTIFLGSAKSSFEGNYLVNRWNIFEMVTYNRTKYWDIEHLYPEVMAVNNWWGSGNGPFIAGRIWDRRDDDNLIRVKYDPFYPSNASYLQGKCYPGWRLFDNRCYLYMGGVLPYHEAVRQCKLDRSRLAWARDRNVEKFLGELVSSRQENYMERWMTWAYHDYSQADACTALVNYRMEDHDCKLLLPYICERNPYVISKTRWKPIIIALGTVGGVLLIVALLICCAVAKARTRKEQRMERRNSIRASLRGSKASLYSNRTQLDNLSDRNGAVSTTEKRSRPPLGSSQHMLNISGVTMDETNDTIEKIKLDSHRPATPHSLIDYHPRNDTLNSSTYGDSDIDYYPRRLENEITNIMARPMYDNVMRGQAFDEQSLDRSRLPSTPNRYGSQDKLASPYRYGSQDRLGPSRYGYRGSQDQLGPSATGPRGSQDALSPRYPVNMDPSPIRPSPQGRGMGARNDYGGSRGRISSGSSIDDRPKPKETSM